MHEEVANATGLFEGKLSGKRAFVRSVGCRDEEVTQPESARRNELAPSILASRTFPTPNP